MYTPLKTNMDPENQCFVEEYKLSRAIGPGSMLVFWRAMRAIYV